MIKSMKEHTLCTIAIHIEINFGNKNMSIFIMTHFYNHPSPAPRTKWIAWTNIIQCTKQICAIQYIWSKTKQKFQQQQRQREMKRYHWCYPLQIDLGLTAAFFNRCMWVSRISFLTREIMLILNLHLYKCQPGKKGRLVCISCREMWKNLVDEWRDGENYVITSSLLRFCGWVRRRGPPGTGPLSGPPLGAHSVEPRARWRGSSWWCALRRKRGVVVPRKCETQGWPSDRNHSLWKKKIIIFTDVYFI